MLKEFKNFILRGNVLDLAVGVIIGAAFTALVKSLVELHDGQVYLEKGTKKGSEFVVKLPNVRIEKEKENENDNKIIDVDNKPLVQKIHIEFSDIYELY